MNYAVDRVNKSMAGKKQEDTWSWDQANPSDCGNQWVCLCCIVLLVAQRVDVKKGDIITRKHPNQVSFRTCIYFASHLHIFTQLLHKQYDWHGGGLDVHDLSVKLHSTAWPKGKSETRVSIKRQVKKLMAFSKLLPWLCQQSPLCRGHH